MRARGSVVSIGLTYLPLVSVKLLNNNHLLGGVIDKHKWALLGVEVEGNHCVLEVSHLHAKHADLLGANILVADPCIDGASTCNTVTVEVKAVEHQTLTFKFLKEEASIELRNNFEVLLSLLAVKDDLRLANDVKGVLENHNKVVKLGHPHRFDGLLEAVVLKLVSVHLGVAIDLDQRNCAVVALINRQQMVFPISKCAVL